MTETEIWINLVFLGFENYEVSSLGRVKSLARKVETRTGVICNRKERIMKPSISSGYLGVILRKDNQGFYIRIHRLVALAFIDNPDNNPVIDHINGVKTDNRASNLRWVTHQENVISAIDIGLSENMKNGKRVAQFSPQFGYIESHRSLTSASKMTGDEIEFIKKSCEGDIFNGHNNYIWLYEDDEGNAICPNEIVYKYATHKT